MNYFHILSKRIFFLSSFFILITGFSYSQAADTLTLAKQLNDEKKFTKAEKLLEPYYKAHPGNLNAQWLFAQTSYFAKHFKRSQEVYEDAITWHPENYTLRLDYAKKLTDIGEFDKAMPLLRLYLTYDSVAPDVHETLAKIHFWKAEYKEALNETDKVLRNKPGNKSIHNLKNEILQAKSPWLKTSLGYTSDDQPLQIISPNIQGGISLHPLANFNVSFQAPIFNLDQKSYYAPWLRAGNKMLFSKQGIELDAEAGVIRLPSNTVSGTGSLQLNKTFIRHLVLSAKAEHLPYLYTRTNMTSPLMQRYYSFATAYTNANSWQGRASFDVNHFYTDNNYIQTASAWLLSPPLKFSVFALRLGYSYNFSTAKENRFVSSKALSDVISYWTEGSVISGTYNPYFTPDMQSVHSAIADLTIHPARKTDIGIKGNICIYGVTQNPYLYLGADPNNHTTIVRGFSKLLIHPANMNVYIATQLSPKINLKAEYVFLKTNFYTSQYVGLSFKISFWNEKKAK